MGDHRERLGAEDAEAEADASGEAREWLERTRGQMDEADVAEAARKAGEAEAAVRKAGALRRHVARVRVLVRMLQDWRAGRYQDVPWQTLASVAALVLYLANPIDLIPDFLPGVGYADDLAVIALVWAAVRRDAENYASWKLASEGLSAEEAKLLLRAFPRLAEQ
ncbi:MAG: YkvA family protein [Armatimonadetes bacterium]|nr:YkvA family protein [Armatimonadota bacterium]